MVFVRWAPSLMIMNNDVSPPSNAPQELEKRCLGLDKREEVITKKDKASTERAALLDARERAATERERSAAEKDGRLQKREEQGGQQAGAREQQLAAREAAVAAREAAAAAKDAQLKDQEKKNKVGLESAQAFIAERKFDESQRESHISLLQLFTSCKGSASCRNSPFLEADHQTYLTASSPSALLHRRLPVCFREPAPLLTLCLAVFAMLSQASAGPAADAERRQLAAALEREKALTLREEAVKTAELQSKAASQVCAVHCVMGKEAIQS